MARTKNPWTRLKKRLDPIVSEIHAASVWRVEEPLSVEVWLKALTWNELLIGDMICEQLCQEPPQLSTCLFSLTQATGRDEAEQIWQNGMIRQVMHRLIYAVDLATVMPVGWRKPFALTGEYAHDSRVVLIESWRTNAPLEWAIRYGVRYV